MRKGITKSKRPDKDANLWSKFWFIVWKDDSPKGWIISIVFLFVVIKFIFFPLLNLVTGTQLPLAIVESCSMYHEGNLLGSYDAWWERHEVKYTELGISKAKFEDYIFKRGFNKGDILFILGVDPKDIEVGDVIIFEAGKTNPLIHRVVQIRTNPETGERLFETIGDNNDGQLSIEQAITEDQIVGRATFKLLPYVGWGKLIFFEIAKGIDSNQFTRFEGLCQEN